MMKFAPKLRVSTVWFVFLVLKRDQDCIAEGESEVCLVFCGELRVTVKHVFCGEFVLYLSCFLREFGITRISA